MVLVIHRLGKTPSVLRSLHAIPLLPQHSIQGSNPFPIWIEDNGGASRRHRLASKPRQSCQTPRFWLPSGRPMPVSNAPSPSSFGKIHPSADEWRNTGVASRTTQSCGHLSPAATSIPVTTELLGGSGLAALPEPRPHLKRSGIVKPLEWILQYMSGRLPTRRDQRNQKHQAVLFRSTAEIFCQEWSGRGRSSETEVKMHHRKRTGQEGKPDGGAGLSENGASGIAGRMKRVSLSDNSSHTSQY